MVVVDGRGPKPQGVLHRPCSIQHLHSRDRGVERRLSDSTPRTSGVFKVSYTESIVMA